MIEFWNALIAALTNSQPEQLLPVLLGLSVTFAAIFYFGGRFWAFLYFVTIPFLNWSFGVIEPWSLVGANETFTKGIELHPLTMVTGLVFVFRDFVQRGMGHKVLVVMALAIAWSFYYAWPVIALASGIAFAISEMTDWLIYTFTKYRLSTRIVLSSAVAAPVDTTIFLYGADLARQMRLGEEPGNMLHWANWIVFILGKMVGAVIVSYLVRRREEAGKIDPYDGSVEPETAEAFR
ncbi:MAG: VUT family protein [Henriciella sp.]|uniref:VUT family protein n=1 Tax=Henriciella sp. TaxID=1968823 RepID=UPI003C753458